MQVAHFQVQSPLGNLGNIQTLAITELDSASLTQPILSHHVALWCTASPVIPDTCSRTIGRVFLLEN